MAAPRHSKRKKDTQPDLHDILTAGKDMMNRSEKAMGAMTEEDRRFREMFGVGPCVALTAWSMLHKLDLLPDGGTLQHFLWTLCFLKVYPKQGPLCALCSGSDPKTVRKWVKLFLDAIASLEPEVVRPLILFIGSFALVFLNSAFTVNPHRLYGPTDSN
jgi:hypothetical protein